MTIDSVGSSLINMYNELTEMKIHMTNVIMEDTEVFPSGPAAGQIVIASAQINQLLDTLENAVKALGHDFTVDNLGPVGDIGKR